MTEEQVSKQQHENGVNLFWAFDFDKLIGPYSLAGVDLPKILERETKNIAALAEANKIAFQGYYALMRRQSEIFHETMAQMVADARKQNVAQSRTEIAKQGFEKALSDMREMAKMTAQYQHKAFDVVHNRIGKNIQELHDTPNGK